MNLCKGLIKENVNIEIYNDNGFLKLEIKKYLIKKIIKIITSFINNIKCIEKYFLFRKKKIKFSNGFTGSTPIPVSEINKFDIIHLHWINNGFFNLEKIKNINVPIVWTIRDMWPFTGGCHYTLGCKNSFIGSANCVLRISNLFFKDDSVLNLFNKKISIFKNQNIHLVGISKWIETEIRPTV